METITDIINALPVPTWNHLGVNGVQTPKFPLPVKEHSGNLFYNLTDGVANARLTIESKADAALENFIAKNATSSLSFAMGTSTTAPLSLFADLDKEENTFVESINVVVEENAKSTINHVVSSDKENTGYYASIIKVRAEKNADVRIVLAQLLADTVNNWSSLIVELEEGASVEVVRVLLGSDKTYAAVHANLIGDNSSFNISTYYQGKHNQLIDINDLATHIGKHTATEMHIAGILDDKATKIYRGTIDFQKGAEKSTGKELDDVLLMSPTVHNRTCPLILCGEETVAGEHAATIGRFNDEQLFYLCSRGLSLDQAKQLLVDAKLHSVVGKIKDEDLAVKIIAFAKNEELDD